MSAVRDWLNTLWRASYKGVPFYFESDSEHGGRDPVIHRFPHRDDPFIEDLGEEPRYFEGTAYVHGDDADVQAVTLTETLAAKGPGILVVPIRGPVLVHPMPFRREHARDKLGYVAFSVKFVRQGAATALVSVALAGAQAFQAADRLAAALANLFPAVVSLNAAPDFVVQAAVDGVQTAAAVLDAERLTTSTDPAVSASVRDQVAAIVTASPTVLTRTPDDAATSALAASLIAATRALAAGQTPEAAASGMIEVATAATATFASNYISPSAQAAAVNAFEAARLARLAALTAWAEALVRRTYASRPDGVTARAEAAERFEQELALAAGYALAPLYIAIEDLRGSVVTYLTQLIADLAPVVTVSANRSLPSLWWSWRLYGSALRSDELVTRNDVRHPSFMPKEFQALAS